MLPFFFAIRTMLQHQNKLLWLIGLCAVWIAHGLFAHEPWKPDEATVFGLAHSVANGQGWLIPRLAGEAHFAVPPLIVWVAAGCLKVFGPGGLGMAAPDAARLSIAILLALTFWGVGLTARRLYGGGHGRYAVLALMACLGLVIRAHQLLPEVAALACFAWAMAGLSEIPSRPWRGGLVAGVAAGLGFLAGGLTGMVMIWAVAGALTAVHFALRSSEAIRWFNAFCVTVAFSLAIALIWPLGLNLSSAAHSQVLRHELVLGLLNLAPNQSWQPKPWYPFQLLTWYALPALPLAIWSGHLMARGFLGGLRQAAFLIPALIFVVLLVWLILNHAPRELYAMPLLLPLAVLAVPGLDHLRRGATALLDWLGIMLFGALMAAAWVYWSAIYFGWPRGPDKSVRGLNPGFEEPVQWWAVVVALCVVAIWLALVRPARRLNRRALLNWTLGLTAAWCVISLLGMPYIDYGKRYKGLISELSSRLPGDVRAGQACMNHRELGDAQRAMVHYYLGLTPKRESAGSGAEPCNWLLVQDGAYEAYEMAPAGPWQVVWVGRRPGDKLETWTLLRRVGEQPNVEHFHEIYRRSTR